MERTERIHEKLKRLPKYSLTDEQRERVLTQIRQNTYREKKFRWLIPLFSILLLCAVTVFLVISYKTGMPMQNADSNYSKEILYKPAEIFSHPSTQQSLLGIEGKVGILGDTDFVAEDTRRVAKLMIFIWGNDQVLTGQSYKVEAVNDEGEQLILSEGVLSGPLYDENAHILTSFVPFPTSGTWRLSFYVNDLLHEEFALEVLSAFPETESYILNRSPNEMTSGVNSDLIIESIDNDQERITVELRTKKGVMIDETIFQKDGEYIDAASAKPLVTYKGTLEFPKSGEWVVVIDGEKTSPFKIAAPS